MQRPCWCLVGGHHDSSPSSRRSAMSGGGVRPRCGWPDCRGHAAACREVAVVCLDRLSYVGIGGVPATSRSLGHNATMYQNLVVDSPWYRFQRRSRCIKRTTLTKPEIFHTTRISLDRQGTAQFPSRRSPNRSRYPSPSPSPTSISLDTRGTAQFPSRRSPNRSRRGSPGQEARP